jgi:hypothetical protein
MLRAVSLGDCPFVARQGARPAALAGRNDILDTVAEQRVSLANGTGAQPQVITGRVGSGRTAVGDEIARVASRAGWAPATISITPSNDVIHEIARGTAAMLLRRLATDREDAQAAALLSTTRSFAAAYGLDLPLDVESAASREWTDDPTEDLGYLFRLLGGAGSKAGAGYLLVIDDIDLATTGGGAECLAAASDVARASMPMLVVFTGLPGTARLLGSSITERELGPLGPAEVFEAIAEPARRRGVDIPAQSIASIGRRTGGYPFFVQALAAAAWEQASSSQITPNDVEAGSIIAERTMMADFFGPVLNALTSGERRFLRAMADVGANPTLEMMSRRLGDANRFNPDSSELVGIRDELLRRRVIYELPGNAFAYAMPLFDRYVGATH